MVYLDIETPAGSRRVPLESERLSIGRMEGNDVVLAFPQVSRQHAELRRVGGQWWIVDLHSTNGLQLDTRRIQDHALRDGDRIVLAPGISVRFVAATASEGAEEGPRRDSGPLWEASGLNQPPIPRFGPLAPMPAASSASSPLRQSHVLPGASQSAPGSLSGPSMPSPASAGREAAASPPETAVPIEFWSAARTAGPAPSLVAGSGAPDAYVAVAGNADARGGYPVPRGPLHSGAPVGGADPYRRDTAAGEAGRATAGPATLLHICQTCGQQTAPGAIYCQHCHNSIAGECANCRLSLLPIQDRCPRCHAPNLHSVRRARARQSAL